VGRRYRIFVAVFESQAVAVVPKLVPVTNTATNLLRCFEVSLKVLRVAPVIRLQVDGTVVRATVTALVQAYHWYRRVGVGYPAQVPRAVRILPTLAVPPTVGLTVAIAEPPIVATCTPLHVDDQPDAEGKRHTRFCDN